ncbi:MAG: hypothetical protein ABI983_01015 [Acidobacteriota bacterium]
MQVLLTVGFFAALAIWLSVVYRRLAILRKQVTLAWKRLEPDQSNEAVKSVYNKHVAAYNAALESFPANVIAPAAGLKPARPF